MTPALGRARRRRAVPVTAFALALLTLSSLFSSAQEVVAQEAGAEIAHRQVAQANGPHQWRLKVASWNLMNLSMNKATYPAGGDRVNLLNRMGAIAGAYDIVVFQEVLQTGASVTAHLINYLPAGYACNHVSAASGRVGRQERYVICAPPANLDGTIAIAPLLDYSTTGVNYTAANGTPQPAANVWMRPPIIATVTFTPNDHMFGPVTFDIYTNHTKPAYGYSAHARPPGTVAGAPNSSSVHYELRAIEQNQGAGANRMLIGDLNADCASYPVGWRGMDFALAAGWTWHVNYGQRTNTAPGTACGYDRIIINAALTAYYQAHGIQYDAFNNNTRLSGKRVSDHYLVWVELGETRAAKRGALVAGLSVPISDANKRRKFETKDKVNVTGNGLMAMATAAKLYITRYLTSFNYKSNFTYDLSDVRGAPSSVTTDGNGTLEQTISWSNPPPGAYVFVFDANGDGTFNQIDGDFANFDTQADILVTEDTTGHNDLVTLGDNMVLRDVFDLGQAYNVYALAKNLPPSFTGNAYIVSDRLLKAAGYTSWEQARASNIDLPTYSIPIQLADVGMVNTAQLTDDDRRQSFTSDADGETFFSAWSHPAQLMNASVNYQAPPSSVFKPSYAGDGDPPASPDDTDYVDDPCAEAYLSTDNDFQQACNLGFLFPNYYGNTFNLVFDLDGDGKLGPSDPIDLRDIGDMTTYFNDPGNTVLGPNASGNPAVAEYKEYLGRALSVELSDDATYDTTTMEASSRYACGPELSKNDFQTLIVPDSQTGFRVLETSAYQSQRQQDSGLYQFDNAFLDGWSAENATQCIIGGDLTYGGEITSSEDSHVVSVADTHQFDNATVSANDSVTCWAAVEGTAGTALAVGAGSGFFTLGAGLVAGLVVAASTPFVGAAVCGLP